MANPSSIIIASFFVIYWDLSLWVCLNNNGIWPCVVWVTLKTHPDEIKLKLKNDIKFPCFPMSSQAGYCLCLSSIILLSRSRQLWCIPSQFPALSSQSPSFISFWPTSIFIRERFSFQNIISQTTAKLFSFQKAETELDEKTSYLNVPAEEIEEVEEEESLTDEEIRRKY